MPASRSWRQPVTNVPRIIEIPAHGCASEATDDPRRGPRYRIGASPSRANPNHMYREVPAVRRPGDRCGEDCSASRLESSCESDFSLIRQSLRVTPASCKVTDVAYSNRPRPHTLRVGLRVSDKKERPMRLRHNVFADLGSGRNRRTSSAAAASLRRRARPPRTPRPRPRMRSAASAAARARPTPAKLTPICPTPAAHAGRACARAWRTSGTTTTAAAGSPPSMVAFAGTPPSTPRSRRASTTSELARRAPRIQGRAAETRSPASGRRSASRPTQARPRDGARRSMAAALRSPRSTRGPSPVGRDSASTATLASPRRAEGDSGEHDGASRITSRQVNEEIARERRRLDVAGVRAMDWGREPLSRAAGKSRI